MTLDQQALIEWVALSTVPRVGAVLMRRLLDHFETPHQVLNAKTDDLLQISGVGQAVAKQIKSADLEEIESSLGQWQKSGINIRTWFDDDYPTMLKGLKDAPPTLFMRGNWQVENQKTVAIVGTRRPSPSASKCATNFARYFASHGWTIVSGLALGIDSYAHTGALNTDGGQTVAVLGSGLNNIYPPKSKKFSHRIELQGALMSEVLPHYEPHSTQLVARNRIISGLSQILIVVFAGPTSGSLHAAKFAKKQDRLVAAVDFIAEGNVKVVQNGGILLPKDGSSLDTLRLTLEERIRNQKRGDD